mgnify:CR=1 FL=1
METINYVDRESWLNAGAVLIQAEVFTLAQIPAETWDALKYRITCGFPIGYRGSKSRKVVLGQAFDPSISADGTYEVCINMLLDIPLKVLEVLAHELGHVHAGIACGHRGEFRRVARAIGLTGPLTATVAGPALKATLEGIAEQLGKYPHAAIDPTLRKKQGTRLLKVACSDCGFIARVSGKWASRISEMSSPCPVCTTVGTLEVDV